MRSDGSSQFSVASFGTGRLSCPLLNLLPPFLPGKHLLKAFLTPSLRSQNLNSLAPGGTHRFVL